MTGFSMPAGTPEEKERAKSVMQAVQQIQTPGIPRGMAM